MQWHLRCKLTMPTGSRCEDERAELICSESKASSLLFQVLGYGPTHLSAHEGHRAWCAESKEQKSYALCRRLLSASRLPSGGLGASISASWGTILATWEHLGASWEQQNGFEVVQNRIFIDFELIFKRHFKNFVRHRGLKFQFLLGLVSRSFFYRCSIRSSHA